MSVFMLIKIGFRFEICSCTESLLMHIWMTSLYINSSHSPVCLNTVPDFPLIGDHPINEEIHIMIIEEFGLPYSSFFHKAEPLNNGATLLVFGCAANLDTIESVLMECIIYQSLA